MKILVDTHVVIWAISSPEKLPNIINEKMQANGTVSLVSSASLWEIAIKYSLGKLDLKDNLENIFTTIFKAGFHLLPISTEHILKVAELPFHHRDPFDRIIIAQSVVEDITILTKDTLFNQYEVSVFWK
jgi:PIN domain nuclease of toxin-antitoxin system